MDDNFIVMGKESENIKIKFNIVFAIVFHMAQ